MQGTMSNGESWAYYAVHRLTEFENDPQVDSLVILSDEAQEVKRSVFKIMQRINEKVGKNISLFVINIINNSIEFINTL